MLDVVPWRPLHAVTWEWFRCAFRVLLSPPSWINPFRTSSPSASKGVPVFVMMPLDVALDQPQISQQKLHQALDKLKQIKVEGVMVDVWWALCEQQPGIYDFTKYITLFRACQQRGLKVQATMSFHACGGNVGDTVNIPLPNWVLLAGEEYAFWFTDREGHLNREYISFGADHEAVLPSNEGDDAKRTPLQAYGDFVTEFVKEMDTEGLMGKTVVELQIGVGPCGELRYPSYPMRDGLWKFPGIGEFQCFDRFLRRDLAHSVRERGSALVREADMPPADTGSYNDTPWDCRFFRKGFKTEAGKFFLQWYSSRLLQHGEDVLKQVRVITSVDETGVAIAVKISGIHWWKFSASRAAEATAGYMKGPGQTAYGDIAKLLRLYNTILDFTCLEMRTIDQPFLKARCGPRQLVSEIFTIAKREGVAVAGENALERFDWGAYAQVLKAFRNCGAEKYGFTLLRLGEALLEEDNSERLRKFVERMKWIE